MKHFDLITTACVFFFHSFSIDSIESIDDFIFRAKLNTTIQLVLPSYGLVQIVRMSNKQCVAFSVE